MAKCDEIWGSSCFAFPSMILSPIRLSAGRRESFAAAVLKIIRGCAAPGENVSLQSLKMPMNRPDVATGPYRGSLPHLFTMREESAFGYITKVMLVPWSTPRGTPMFQIGLVGKASAVYDARKAERPGQANLNLSRFGACRERRQ